MDDELAAWGKVVMLETRGRRSGRPRRTAVGYIEDPDGGLRVAARDADTAWALNLLADPRCRTEREGESQQRIATQLVGRDREDTIRQLILKYGTPAESLGAGPAFRLVLDEARDGAAGPSPA